MAPSSRSNRARNTNPLDPSRLLKDDEQQKWFLNHYIERPVMTPKYGSLAAFEEQGCHFPSLIRAQGLHVFVEDKTPFYIELIRVFYCNLKLKTKLYTPMSKANKLSLHILNLANAEISWKRSRSAAGSSRETLGVGNFIVENHLLHYFLEILQKFNVDFTIELETPFSIKEHRIDLTSLGKMQIVEALDGSLRHKDQQVEDNAPLEAPAQPAPPAPQDLGNSPYY
ncbi:hypothetical protein Lal_00018531 [Lupinus albus]|nr:hypothetical protein Lal_00018531 [Lupinus albus]